MRSFNFYTLKIHVNTNRQIVNVAVLVGSNYSSYLCSPWESKLNKCLKISACFSIFLSTKSRLLSSVELDFIYCCMAQSKYFRRYVKVYWLVIRPHFYINLTLIWSYFLNATNTILHKIKSKIKHLTLYDIHFGTCFCR